MSLSVIGRLCWLSVFRTRESNGRRETAREAHPKSAKGSEFQSGGSLKLQQFFMKNFVTFTLSVTSRRWQSLEKSSLFHDSTLDPNVATLAIPILATSLEHRDVSWHHTLERCDVGFIDSLSHCDVKPQRRDIAVLTLWNVVTLSLNVAMLPLFYVQNPLVFFPTKTLSLSSQIPSLLPFPAHPSPFVPTSPRNLPRPYAHL